MLLSNILFPNKFLLLLRNENASLLLYENGKLVLKSIISGSQYKNEWESILEQHRDYPIEILIDNGLEFFHELPLSHLNFLDRLRCMYYKRKELKIFNNCIECFVSRSKDQVFANFLTFAKTHKLYPLIEWIDTQKNFFLGVRLFCLELCSFLRKNFQEYSEGNKMFFISETSDKLRQIVIAENRILLERNLFVGESKQPIFEKIKQETTTMGTYFSRQNIIIENVIVISNQKISGLESIFKETQTAFSLHEIILKSSHSDIPWLDKIIIQNIGCEPSRFIIKSPTYYRSLISYYINKKFSWICSIFFILILMVGILLYQKKIYDTHRRHSLENEINVLRKMTTNFEKELKFKDIEGVRKSITAYEKISLSIQNPLILIFELIPLAKEFSITLDNLTWSLSDQGNIEAIFTIKFQQTEDSKEKVLKKLREIKEVLQARYGKKNIEILSTPYKCGTHELYTETYNSVEVDHLDSPSFKTRIPQAMIKMRLK